MSQDASIFAPHQSAAPITAQTLKNLGRYDFPDPAHIDPDGVGLVATGGDLAPETLISAYAQGLFPWFNEDDPIAWWCPEPRCIITPIDYQPSKSLRKLARRARWQVTLDKAFDEVMHACSLPRFNGGNNEQSDDAHTWIHDEMITAYSELHRFGFAHSVEVWDESNELIGGLYGLKIGNIYFGESMFHTVSNASKLAFWGLMRLCVDSNVKLVDCQLPNDHLLSLGATTMPRADFLATLDTLIGSGSVRWSAQSHQPLAASLLNDDCPNLWTLK